MSERPTLTLLPPPVTPAPAPLPAPPTGLITLLAQILVRQLKEQAMLQSRDKPTA
jgi:hypothetical protein